MIDRYHIYVPRDMDYEYFISSEGAYVLWDDVEPLLKEIEELRDFYNSIEHEVNWAHWRLKK